jgi:hypothetical protein
LNGDYVLFNLIQSNSASSDGSSTTIAVSLTGVGAGNLIIIWVKGDTGGDTTITCSDGTSSLSPGTKVYRSSFGGVGCFFYLLSANAGNKTYTATFGIAKEYRRIGVYEFSHDLTILLDQETNVGGSSSGANSGNIATTGTSEVVFGGASTYYRSFTSNTYQINDVSGDGLRAINSTDWLWHKIFAATFTGHAQATISGGSDEWICGIMAFKEIGGGILTKQVVALCG